MFPGLTKFRWVSIFWYFVNFLVDYTETGVINEDLHSPLIRKPCTTGEKKTPNHAHCGSFYTCDSSGEWLIHFCTFPQLFSHVFSRCLPFGRVYCDDRYEPTTPCGYRQEYCKKVHGRCVCRDQQDIDYNFCRNRADGFYPTKPALSPLYIECNQERTLLKKCEDANFVFNQEKKKCLNIFVLVYPHLLLNATFSVSSSIPSLNNTTSRVTFEPINVTHVTESEAGQDNLTEKPKHNNIDSMIRDFNSYRTNAHLSNSMSIPIKAFQSQYDVSVSYQKTWTVLSSNRNAIQITRTSLRESSETEERSMTNVETPAFLTRKTQFVTLSDSYRHSERFHDDATAIFINSEHSEESILLLTPNLPRHTNFPTFDFVTLPETSQGPESVSGWPSHIPTSAIKLSTLSQVTHSPDYQQANTVTNMALHASPSDIESNALLFSKADQLKSYSNTMIYPTPELVISEAVSYQLLSPTEETSHLSQSSSKGLNVLQLIKQTPRYTSNTIILTLASSPQAFDSKQMLTYHRQTSQNYLSDEEIQPSVKTQFLLSSSQLDDQTFHASGQLTKVQVEQVSSSNARFGFHSLEADIMKSVSETFLEGPELTNEAYHKTSSFLDGDLFIKIITDELQNNTFLTGFPGSFSTTEITFIKPTPSSLYHAKTHLSELSNKPISENPFLAHSFANEYKEEISLRTREQASSNKNSVGTENTVSRQTSADITFTENFVFSGTSYLDTKKPESTYLTNINSGESPILSIFDTKGDMSSGVDKQSTSDHVSSVISKLELVHAPTYETNSSTEIHSFNDLIYQNSKQITSATVMNTISLGYASDVTKVSEVGDVSTDAAKLNSKQSLSYSLTGELSSSDATSIVTGSHLSGFTTSITDNISQHLIGENSVDMLTYITKFRSGQYISTVTTYTDISLTGTFTEGTTFIDTIHTSKHMSTTVYDENRMLHVSTDGTYVYNGNQEFATSSNVEELVHGHASSTNELDLLFEDVSNSVTRGNIVTYMTSMQRVDQSFLDISNAGTNYMTIENVYRNSIEKNGASNIWVTESIPSSKGTVTTETQYLLTPLVNNNVRYHNTGMPVHIEMTLSSNDNLVMSGSEYPTEPLPFKISETHIRTNGVDIDWEKGMTVISYQSSIVTMHSGLKTSDKMKSEENGHTDSSLQSRLYRSYESNYYSSKQTRFDKSQKSMFDSSFYPITYASQEHVVNTSLEKMVDSSLESGFDMSLGTRFDSSVESGFNMPLRSRFDSSLENGFDMSLGIGFDSSLESGFDMSLGTRFDSSLENGFDMSLGSGFDMSLRSRFDSSLESGFDKSLGSRIDSSFKDGFDTSLESGFDSSFERGFGMYLGSGFYSSLESDFDMSLGSGFYSSLERGFDMSSGSGFDSSWVRGFDNALGSRIDSSLESTFYTLLKNRFDSSFESRFDTSLEKSFDNSLDSRFDTLRYPVTVPEKQSFTNYFSSFPGGEGTDHIASVQYSIFSGTEKLAESTTKNSTVYTFTKRDFSINNSFLGLSQPPNVLSMSNPQVSISRGLSQYNNNQHLTSSTYKMKDSSSVEESASVLVSSLTSAFREGRSSVSYDYHRLYSDFNPALTTFSQLHSSTEFVSIGDGSPTLSSFSFTPHLPQPLVSSSSLKQHTHSPTVPQHMLPNASKFQESTVLQESNADFKSLITLSFASNGVSKSEQYPSTIETTLRFTNVTTLRNTGRTSVLVASVLGALAGVVLLCLLIGLIAYISRRKLKG